MKTPPPIKPGSKIRIVSPAGKTTEKHILPAVKWLKERGYGVELGKHVFTEHFQFAGTDEQRLSDLQAAFDDPETAAIICSRGGYGTVKIIDQLDFSAFRKKPKWLVGYSDITVLHLAIHKLGIESIHGTMPPFFFHENGEANDNLNSLRTLLTGKNATYTFPTLAPSSLGCASGELIGGNLSIITSLLRTKYEPATNGKILFIEDIDEYLYQVDRMMLQLKLAGKLKQLSGLIVGDFTEIKDNDKPFGKTIKEIIWEAVKEYNYPVSFGLKAGHDKVNLALTFSKKWELNVSKKETTLTTLIKNT